jgi:hypothetical protein
MKKTDIAAVILISVISTVIAYFIGNALLGDPNEESISVTYMDVISADVSEPNPEVFNPDAVNPTVEIYVGNCQANQTWDPSTQTCISPSPAATENPNNNGTTDNEED